MLNGKMGNLSGVTIEGGSNYRWCTPQGPLYGMLNQQSAINLTNNYLLMISISFKSRIVMDVYEMKPVPTINKKKP